MATIELNPVSNIDSIHVVPDDETNILEAPSSRPQHALPPADQGYQAWLCLAGCFVANVLIWGFAFSFGVLQEYYTSHEPFASHPAGIPAVGTTATGLSYLTMPIYFSVFQKFPDWRRWSCLMSLPLMGIALVGASFANSVPPLLFCQGVLYALAGNALITPTITYLDEWFVTKKGLAVGIMWAGDGTGGVIMPLLLQAMLSRIGFRWTLRAIAAIITICMTPMLYFLKPRVPISSTQATRPVNLTFLRSPLFWTLQTFNILQALGYFLPSNYLPSYIKSLGLNPTLGSLTLLLMNLASILGCIFVGYLQDRIEITFILLILSVLAATTVLLLWGLSVSFAPIAIFCLAYGFTAGAYSTSWGGMVKDIQRRHEGINTSMLFGLLALGRGVGAIVSGPLSETLIGAGTAVQVGAKVAYETRYGSIIILSGCTALCGGGSWLVRRAGWI